MLDLPDFVDSFQEEPGRAGSLAVIFLATFSPIGDAIGIPAVQLAGEHLGRLVLGSAPKNASVGDISDVTFGVFLPGSTLAGVADLVRSLRAACIEEDLEVAPGLWAEIRPAIGGVHVPGDAPAP